MSDYYCCRKKKKETSGYDYLPDEIIYAIQLRLPVKSLLRFRSVCRPWNSLIKSSAFIDAHLKHSIQSNVNKNDDGDRLLVLARKKKKYGSSSHEFLMLHCDGDEYKERVIRTNTNWEGLYASGTCNGLVCLSDGDVPMLWNPYVRKIVVLPYKHVRLYEYNVHFQLGYDPHANDFKVLRLVLPGRPHNRKRCKVRVFSLLEGSWKKLKAPAGFRPFLNNLQAVVISGVLHWLSAKSFASYKDASIATYDMSSELFGKIMLPDALKINGDSWYKSTRYKESQFALLHQDGRNLLVDLWVMEKNGVAYSWTKLWTLGISDSIYRSSIYFRKSGELMIGMDRHTLQSLDPKSQQSKKLMKSRVITSIMDPLVESLVLLDHPDALICN